MLTSQLMKSPRAREPPSLTSEALSQSAFRNTSHARAACVNRQRAASSGRASKIAFDNALILASLWRTERSRHPSISREVRALFSPGHLGRPKRSTTIGADGLDSLLVAVVAGRGPLAVHELSKATAASVRIAGPIICVLLSSGSPRLVK